MECTRSTRLNPPGGCIVKETNPTGYPDDISDTGNTNEVNDRDAADDDSKGDMLTGRHVDNEIKVTLQQWMNLLNWIRRRQQ